MSQHDYNIANQSGAAFRADLNLLLMAILSQNSGVTPPPITTPYMLWADTANDLMMMRNAANNGWVKLFTLSTNASPGVRQQQATYFTTSGSSTAFTLTPYPAAAYNLAGARYRITFHTAPTGAAPTLSVSGQAAAALKYKDHNALKIAPTSVQVPTGWTADVEFDGTDWVIITPTVPQPMTPTEILTRLMTVDGSGSGLDADTVDGKDSTTFTSWYWYWTGTIVNGTLYTINLPAVGGNGLLAVIPYLECVTADGTPTTAFPVGTHLPFSSLYLRDGSMADIGAPHCVWNRNANTVTFRIGSSAGSLYARQGDTIFATEFPLTLSRWRFKVVVISSIV